MSGGKMQNSRKTAGLKALLLGCAAALFMGGCGMDAGENHDRTDLGQPDGGTEQGAPLTIREEELALPGLTEEFELIFLADTHVSLCDDRDAELAQKAAARYESFRDAEGAGADESFQALMAYVKEEQPDLLVLGGDIVDSAMWASIDFVEEELKESGVPWMYEMGNHDFEYGQEYFTERAYEEYLPRLQSVSGTRDGCQIQEYEEFVILLVDDRCNQVSEGALEALKSLSGGESVKPVLLVMHVPVEPLAGDTLLEETKEVWGPSENDHSRVLLGENSCEPNDTTEEFLELVMDEESPVALVLAGHIHFYHKDVLTGDLVQIVTGAGYQREVVKLKIRPQ